MAIQLDNISECVEKIANINNNQLVVGAPLGIGKPNQLLNAIWQLAKQDSAIHLEVFTALSLQVPKGK